MPNKTEQRIKFAFKIKAKALTAILFHCIFKVTQFYHDNDVNAHFDAYVFIQPALLPTVPGEAGQTRSLPWPRRGHFFYLPSEKVQLSSYRYYENVRTKDSGAHAPNCPCCHLPSPRQTSRAHCVLLL